MGSGDFFNKEKEIEAKQDRQDKANKITIRAYKYIRIGAVAAVVAIIVAVALAVLFHIII
jgi:hypothetical protein